MKPTRTVCLLYVLCIILRLAKTNNKRNYSLRWISKDTALNFLTRRMSDMESFQKLLRPIVVERVSGTAGNKAVQKHIISSLKNWHIEEDRFIDATPYGETEFTNIIATFNPNKTSKVVLACHFDSKYFANFKFLAASDSAVPCAVLLDTARQLQCLLEKGAKETSSAKDLTLQLIFFDGEEAFKDWTATDSIYGSRHLAERWTVEPDPSGTNLSRIEAIREFILLDLIGTKDTTIPQQFSSTSDLYEHLVKTENNLRSKGYLTGKHPGSIFNGHKLGGGIEDDHVPFLQRGVDILHLISAPFPRVWHHFTDDWDHLDFNLIDDFSRIFRVFISNLLHLQPEHKSCHKRPNHQEL